jgi:hypothetical protein
LDGAHTILLLWVSPVVLAQRVCLVDAHANPTGYLIRVGCKYFGQKIICPCLANYLVRISKRGRCAFANKILGTNQTMTKTWWASFGKATWDLNQTHPKTERLAKKWRGSDILASIQTDALTLSQRQKKLVGRYLPAIQTAL